MAAATINGKDCRPAIVCVTGATENRAKVRHLLDIPEAGEKLKLFRADLLEEGSFEAAVDGCDGVFHVASPVNFAPKDPENDLIKPAVAGTLNVLRACTKAETVKRVVVTSSGAALMINELEEHNQDIDETCWTDVDFVRTKMSPGKAYAVASNIQPAAESLRLCRLDVRATTLVRFIPWPSMLHPHPLFTMKDGHPTATSMPIYSGCQNLRRIHPIFPSAHLQ